MSKRKFTRFGEKPVAYECTKSKCKWQGTIDQKERKTINKRRCEIEYVCPKCGNNEFYGLLDFNP